MHSRFSVFFVSHLEEDEEPELPEALKTSICLLIFLFVQPDFTARTLSLQVLVILIPLDPYFLESVVRIQVTYRQQNDKQR